VLEQLGYIAAVRNHELQHPTRANPPHTQPSKLETSRNAAWGADDYDDAEAHPDGNPRAADRTSRQQHERAVISGAGAPRHA
jgi:hypothetical protein